MRHSFSTQEVFGVSSALFGLISKESILTSGITQSLSEFKGAPRYEGEIGFRMKAVDLDTLIQTYPFNKENVIPFIKNIMWVLEIVDFRNFGGDTKISFTIGNIFYKNTIIGKEIPFNQINSEVLERILIIANHNNKEIQGNSSAVEPSILDVLAQVLNHARKYEIPVENDYVIITCSFIGVNVITPNKLVKIDFGPILGTVEYTLVDN